MYAIYKRELLSFLTAPIGYIIMGVFLLASGILLWFFPETSILDYGYAELTGFFTLAPFLLMFLIPAICMRSFAEERKEGTYVLLATRPVTVWQIILAKYFACFSLAIITLVPTLVYYYSLNQLGLPKGNVDGGAIVGSYIGLCLLCSAFAAIGVFGSSLTKSQVVAFVIAVFFCFVLFSGFDSIAKLTSLQFLATEVAALGMTAHFESIARGVLDTRDVVYFITLDALVLGLTWIIIGGRKW